MSLTAGRLETPPGAWPALEHQGSQATTEAAALLGFVGLRGGGDARKCGWALGSPRSGG